MDAATDPTDSTPEGPDGPDGAGGAERIEVQRRMPVPAHTIFEVLCDPIGHVDIDSSGMLMDATGSPVQAAGDSFVVHMDREALNDYPLGEYDVTVHGRSSCVRPAVPAGGAHAPFSVRPLGQRG